MIDDLIEKTINYLEECYFDECGTYVDWDKEGSASVWSTTTFEVAIEKFEEKGFYKFFDDSLNGDDFYHDWVKLIKDKFYIDDFFENWDTLKHEEQQKISNFFKFEIIDYINDARY